MPPSQPISAPPQSLLDLVRQYGIVDMANLEMISFCFWEKLTYVSGTTTALTFFTAQHADTLGNLPLAGQLPSGFFFIVQAIRFAPQPTTTVTAAAAPAAGVMAGALNDMIKLLQGDCKLTIGTKEYGRWPGFMLPAGGGPYGWLSNMATLTAPVNQFGEIAINGVPDPRSVYSLPVPLMIPPQYDFKFIATWAAALTLAAGDTPIYAALDGTLIRPKQ